MGFGTTAENEKKMFGGFEEEFKMGDVGEYIIRFLAGAVRVSRCFIPVLGEDDEGNPKRTAKTIIRPQRDSVMALLAGADKQVKRELGWEKDDIQSVFDPPVYFAYYLTVKDAPKEFKPGVQVGFIKWTIAEALNKLEKQASKKNKDALMYGLWWMYDVICEREEGKGQARFSTKYNVRVDNSENPVANKVPSIWLPGQQGPPADFDPMAREGKYSVIFPEEDKVAIENFWKEHGLTAEDSLLEHLAERYKPATDLEVAAFFSDILIDPDAEDLNGNPHFPEPELFLERVVATPQLRELGVNFENLQALPSPSPKSLKAAAAVEVDEAGEGVVDAQEKPAKSANKKKAPPPKLPLAKASEKAVAEEEGDTDFNFGANVEEGDDLAW